MSDDIKDLLEEQNRTFEAFKESNDQLQKQVKDLGAADVVTEEKVAKINASLDTFEDTNQKLTKALEDAKAEKEAADAAAKEAAEAATKAAEESAAETKERIDALETALNRSGTGGSSVDEAKAEAKAKLDLFIKWGRRGIEGLDAEEAATFNSEQKALTVGDDTQAGFLAPVEYVREIIKGETVFSPVRTVARVRQTSNRSIQVPRRTGQFAAVWVAETGTRAETTGLTYGLEEIPTHEFYALVDVNNQMLEDSEFNLEAELQEEFTEQFGVAEGAGFVTGSGVGQPEGFMTNGDVSSDTSGSAATIADTDGQADGLITLMHALKEAYARNAVWALARVTIGSVRKLKDADNNYIWQPGNLSSGIPNQILGSPYLEMTDMPVEAANAFPMAFGDFRRAYTILDRISMSVLRDPFTQSTSGNVRFLARRRVGGQVVLPEAVRKLQCAV
jgi:HK97 family phage major capsid protein